MDARHATDAPKATPTLYPDANPWRRPATDVARSFVAAAIKAVDDYEQDNNTRKRARTAAARRTHEAALTALMCELATVRCGYHSGDWRAVYRGNKTIPECYRTPLDFRTFPKFLDTLVAARMIEQRIGDRSSHRHRLAFHPELITTEKKRQPTTVRSGIALDNLIHQSGVRPTDFEIDGVDETIVLRRKDGYNNNLLPYVDTDDTQRMRREMTVINDALSCADLSLPADIKHDYDLTNRTLYRMFTYGSFSSSGRLYRAFWVNMERGDRARLRIDGEACCEPDFTAMFSMLLYAREGLELPQGDPYAIPGFEGCRPGIKQMMNGMLSAQKPLRQWPEGVRELFPKGTRPSLVADAIKAHHQSVAHLIDHPDTGQSLMHQESEIMVEISLRSNERGHTVLPLHDGVIVKRSIKEETSQLMEDVSHDKVGIRLPVKRPS